MAPAIWAISDDRVIDAITIIADWKKRLIKQKLHTNNSGALMGQLVIETAGENSGVCACCGHETRTVWGYVREADRTIAAYFVQWTVGMPKHRPTFDFLVGTWGDDSVRDKQLVSWMFDSRSPAGGFMVVDSSDRPAARSEICAQALTRNQVTANRELMDRARSLIDAVWLDDPRLEEVRGFAGGTYQMDRGDSPGLTTA